MTSGFYCKKAYGFKVKKGEELYFHSFSSVFLSLSKNIGIF